MAGLLEGFGMNLDDVKAVSGFDIPKAGYYTFEIGAAFIKDGSEAHPDDSWIIVEFLLENEDGSDGGKTSTLYQLPRDLDNPTEAELKTMGRYKNLLLDLGFAEEDLNTVGEDELVGIVGTLQIVHSQGRGANKGKTYANVQNVRVSADDVETTFEPEPEPEPAKAAPRRERRSR